MSEVKLGLGRAAGMAYTAPAGTALPSTSLDTIPDTWKIIGDVSSDGITLTTDKSVEKIKNWANVIKRVIMTDHEESVSVPLIDTTEDVFKALVGAGNVTKNQGVVTVNLSDNALPAPAAYMFVMKDGDDMIIVGCSEGQITTIENTSFQPGGAITWTTSIVAQGEGMKLIMEEGDVNSTSVYDYD